MGKKMILATTLLVALPATHVNALEEKATVSEIPETSIQQSQEQEKVETPNESNTNSEYTESTIPEVPEETTTNNQVVTEQPSESPVISVKLTGFQVSEYNTSRVK